MGCILSKRISSIKASKTQLPTTRLTILKPVKRESNGVDRNSKPRLTNIESTRQPEPPARRMRQPPPVPPDSPVRKKRTESWDANDDYLKTTHNVHLVEELTIAASSSVQKPSGSSRGENPTASGSGQSRDRHVVEDLSQTRTQLLSIEDLDTEVESYKRYSAERFHRQHGERINPPTTDVLLPRRKLQSEDVAMAPTATSSGGRIVIENAQFTDLLISGNSAHDEVSSSVLPIGEEIDSGSKSQNVITTAENTQPVVHDPVENSAKVHNLRKTKHFSDVFAEIEGDKAVVLDKSETESIGQTDDIYVGLKQSGTKAEAVDMAVPPTNSPSLKSISVFMPGHIQMTEHEKDRLKRKRKRGRHARKKSSQFGSKESIDRRSDTPTVDAGVPITNKTTIRNRPVSGASTLTIDSFDSQGSSLPVSRSNTFVTDGILPKAVKPPKELRSDSFYDNAELVDIEDTPDIDSSAITVTANTNKWHRLNKQFGIKTENDFSDEHGVLFDNRNLNDLDMKLESNSGPSSSAAFTKQKLMYSRFARRRPNSETRFNVAGKPPIPPSRGRRPMSETILNPTHMSRFYTEDMDMHD